MVKNLLVLLIPLILLSSPIRGFADCLDLGNFTDWIVEGTHRIIFYDGEKPLAVLNIPYCEIYPSSTLHLLKSYVCDSDSLVIDGEQCSIMTVKALF